MLLPDASIDTVALAALVEDEFGPLETSPVFVPVGGDSWNYRAGQWWVSVRRDRQGHSPASYAGACELRERGHEFVLAPSRGRRGGVVFDLAGRPVVVSPFVEAAIPECLSRDETAALLRSVEALHKATVSAAVPSESFELYFESELEDSLQTAEAGAGAAGPMSAAVSALVGRNRDRIKGWWAEIRELQRRCRAASRDFVLTHGEPDPPNLLMTRDGDLLVTDWGDLLWAPPERDARALANVGIDLPGRADLKRFYELRWNLGEVAEYVARFTRPHAGNAEDVEKLRQLRRYLI